MDEWKTAKLRQRPNFDFNVYTIKKHSLTVKKYTLTLKK